MLGKLNIIVVQSEREKIKREILVKRERIKMENEKGMRKKRKDEKKNARSGKR